MDFFAPALCKLVNNVRQYVRNEYKGLTLPEDPVGSVIKYRQDIVAKTGLLKQLFKLLKTISPDQDLSEGEKEEWFESVQQAFIINITEIPRYQQGLELILETINSIVQKNLDNQTMSNNFVKMLQHFVFVDNLPSLLITIFKNQTFSLKKEEIHNE